MKRLLFILAMLFTFLVPTAAYANTATSPAVNWVYYYSSNHYQIVGTGLFVDGFYKSFYNAQWPGTLYESSRMIGPGGYATPWVLYHATLGNTADASIIENRNMTAGTWCAEFDLYGKPITEKCESVHA